MCILNNLNFCDISLMTPRLCLPNSAQFRADLGNGRKPSEAPGPRLSISPSMGATFQRPEGGVTETRAVLSLSMEPEPWREEAWGLSPVLPARRHSQPRPPSSGRGSTSPRLTFPSLRRLRPRCSRPATFLARGSEPKFIGAFDDVISVWSLPAHLRKCSGQLMEPTVGEILTTRIAGDRINRLVIFWAYSPAVTLVV